MNRLRLLAVAAVLLGGLAVPDAALACNGWNEPSMETQLMCIVCHERLDQSNSPFATQVKQHLVQWCAAGWTADRVKSTLVAQFGEQILAAPPKQGFDLLAWVVPGAALALGAAVAATLAWIWSRSRRGPPGGDAVAVDPAMDARIDADLAGFE